MSAIPDHILGRKGARRMADIPSDVLDFLNKGIIETKNLSEWLAVDQFNILKILLKDLNQEEWLSSFQEVLSSLKKPTASSNIKAIGIEFGILTSDPSIFKRLRSHPSDIVRSWSCWAESTHHDTTATLLEAMRPYAADLNAGIREVVIFATKERLTTDLDKAIKLLSKWSLDPDENIRRYAVEAIRPIGVWTKKIQALKDSPKMALPILQNVKADPAKYVQNAVGNWLNDASKSQQEWVKSICYQWSKDSTEKATAYIIKRGLRTINK